MKQRITILGVSIDEVTEDEAVEQIEAFIASGEPHHVVTVNPEFVMEAQHNAVFRTVLAQADLATPDGIGILVAARWQGKRFRGRVTGVELTLQLAKVAATKGYRIFLLGAAEGVAEATAHVLQQRFAGLQIVGCYAGTPSPRHEPFLCQLIQHAQPDILLVAYGHPAQDLWIARNQPTLRIPVAIGVGGVFDYLSGRVPRAPWWLRRVGLEWAYRLYQQPRRWRRIINAVPRFLWAVLCQGLRSE